MNEMSDMREGAEVAPGILGREADHVNDGVEMFLPHGFFKPGTLTAVARDQADSVRIGSVFPPVIAGHLMSFFQQDANDAGADVPATANDTNFHLILILFCSPGKSPALGKRVQEFKLY